MRSKGKWQFVAIGMLMLMSLLMTQCGPGATPEPVEEPTMEPTEEATEYSMAMILPGTIQDADFNTIGYTGLQHVGDAFDMETAYSEQVPVADAERVAREYVAAGYSIVAFHGGQFLTAVQTLSDEFPEVSFIIVTSGYNPDIDKPNVWNVGRKYHLIAYPLGVLGARMTESGQVGWITGLELPSFVASVNAIDQAIEATDPDVEFVYSFTGDQNDPVKARQTAEAMIGEGVDFIILGTNLATMGVMEAAASAESQVHLTTLYTDKSSMAPESFTVSIIFDFAEVFDYVVGEIVEGQPGGYYEMGPGSGMELSDFYNTPEDIAADVRSVWNQIINGELEVEEEVQELP